MVTMGIAASEIVATDPHGSSTGGAGGVLETQEKHEHPQVLRVTHGSWVCLFGLVSWPPAG
jgi:hypothetical protein